MKNTNKLKILVVILMGILILCSARMTFAAQAINNITTIPATDQPSATNNTSLNNISNTSGTQPNNTSNNAIVTNKVNNTSNNTQNTTLPKTGAELSVGLVGLISFVSISAIYTYIKVRKYNI